MFMKQTVIILGGGIAGMSAAHELVERGFQVKIYEQKSIPGGKARSIPYQGSGKDGRKDLPGEHGFRFFPRFYRHVTDTMKRIPYQDNRQGVYDNLSQTSRLEIARFDKAGIQVISRFPRSLDDLKVILKDILSEKDTDISTEDIEFFAERTWQLITSCQERRLGEYEQLPWWEYVDAAHRSLAYQNLLAKGITTSLVASRAKLASTKTMGDIFIQLLLDIVEPGISSDLLLDGPTNDVWIQPWLNYLQQQGVEYNLEARVKTIACEDGRIESVTIETKDGGELQVRGDYYIAAMPVEMMAGLLSDGMVSIDPTLANIKRLSISTAWMNGIQFYLKKDIPVTEGHVLYTDTPWALTSISQKQFWQKFDWSQYGDGTVKGIISAIASDWGFFTDPNTGKVAATENSIGIKIKQPAYISSPEEIKDEIWAQLKRSLNVEGQEILTDDNLHSWFMDPDIATPRSMVTQTLLDEFLPESLHHLFNWISPKTEVSLDEVASYLQSQDTTSTPPDYTAIARIQLDLLANKGFIQQKERHGILYYITCLKIPTNVNAEPLLVNLVNTWQLRPHAYTKIPNFFLASDYVRTNTDLATMEGANEAARRAVNAIVNAAGVQVPYCKIWDLHEPWILVLWRWHDRYRYQNGLPWKKEIPWWLMMLQQILLSVWQILSIGNRWRHGVSR